MYIKALILAKVRASQEAEILDRFRGRAAHNYDWLRHQYAEVGGEEKILTWGDGRLL